VGRKFEREWATTHYKLEEVGDWCFADFVLRVEGVLDSMNKAKELGFFINWMIIHFATL
jgi:hypothetical protein